MRCPERVIGTVNGIFGGGRIEQEFVRFRELRARPGCPAGGTWRLDLDPIEEDGKRPSQEERLLRECEQVARFVAGRGLSGLGIRGWAELAVLAPRVALAGNCRPGLRGARPARLSALAEAPRPGVSPAQLAGGAPARARASVGPLRADRCATGDFRRLGRGPGAAAPPRRDQRAALA